MSEQWRIERCCDQKHSNHMATLYRGSEYIVQTCESVANEILAALTAARELAEARARVSVLANTLDAMIEAKDGLLRQRDEYMDRFGLLLPWLTEHVKKHDSDVVDADHGPIVEWDYCDWCEDHGLPSDWPCVFARAANPTLARPEPAEPVAREA